MIQLPRKLRRYVPAKHYGRRSASNIGLTVAQVELILTVKRFRHIIAYRFKGAGCEMGTFLDDNEALGVSTSPKPSTPVTFTSHLTRDRSTSISFRWRQ